MGKCPFLLMSIPPNKLPKKWKPRHESYTETINYIKGRKAGTIKSLLTPWRSLNEAALGGIQWGDALLMAARPGIGKTIWADQLINESFILNSDQKFRVLKFEWEMWDVVSVIRELSANLGKSYQYVCSAGNKEAEGELSNAEIKQCVAYLANKVARDKEGQLKYPIDVVSDTMTVEVFENTCKEYAESYPDYNILVVVDHIRLADLVPADKDERGMLQNMSKAVIRQKKAKRLNKISFILLTHLNREVTKADRCQEGSIANYMVESDIFGSDSMSQACEIIMAWDRPSKRQIRFYGPSRFIMEERTLVAQNIKVRNGDTGMTFYEGVYEQMKIVEIESPAKAAKKEEYKKATSKESFTGQTSMHV